jgi:uncharacterized protein (TIGR03083 family)
VEVAEHIAALRREAERLASAASRADLDAAIPTCPGWRVRDLLRHMGEVHRWASAHVTERRMEPIAAVDTVAGPLPQDAGLLDWFREGHARLVRSLETADPDVQCWTFLPAPSPLAFWARRQAHETGIHRADAESPSGAITPFEPAFAVDGVDELLRAFLSRPGDEVTEDSTPTLHLHAADRDGEWLVRLGQGRMEVRREHGPADCTVIGSASDLQLLVWNRRAPQGLDVQGDASILAFWRETVQVHWSRPR